MPSSLRLLVFALCTTVIHAISTEYGLAGFPAHSYDPVCATACLRSFNTLDLSCSSEGATVGMITFSTSTECYAQNEPYLKSVAWCTHVKCADYEPSAALLEYWWDMQITGQKTAGVATVPAKWTYGEALSKVRVPPELQLTSKDTTLNVTSLARPEVYEAQFNVLASTHHEGRMANMFGIILLVVSFGLPVMLTWLDCLPLPSWLISRLRPYLVWPSSVKGYHVQSLPYLVGKPPTMGQVLYISLFLILNVVFTAAGYRSDQPNAWNPTVHSEIMSYVLNRTGTLAYVITPLLFLFAGRNNILLWMTNWSHSTFLTLHRWVARIYTIQVLLHSIVSLAKYVQTGMYDMEKSKSYWIWGIVATLCVVVLCFGSGLYVRNFYYQAFVAVHVVLSVLVVVGCWYHAYDLYGLLGGYGYWMYAAAAVWAFDRAGRLLRMHIAGVRRSRISDIGGADGYVRIDIPGIRWAHTPGRHAYLYFPTLTPLKPWENHPFSIMPTVMLRPSYYHCRALNQSGASSEQASDRADSNEDIEKSVRIAEKPQSAHDAPLEVGLTFFVRKGLGLTKLLRSSQDVLTLVEGPYPNNSSGQVLACDRLLLIGGGIGITALIPFVAVHYNVKLCWSVRESARCLVDEIHGVLEQAHDKEVHIGRRNDITALLARESEAGWKKVGVVVAGPPEMCDEARMAITAAARSSSETQFEMEIEAYSW